MSMTELSAVPNDRFEVRNPYDGSLVGLAPRLDEAAVLEALEAVCAYDGALTPPRRARVLAQTAALLEAEAEDFALLMSKESGNCLKDSRTEVVRSVGNLKVAAEEATRLHGEALCLDAGAGGKVALTLFEPIGVVAAITPFNRPLNQVVVKAAPAIAANNAIIVKPSEKTPLTALAFAELMHRAGLPESMLRVVTGDPETIVGLLLASERVGMLSFTGGTRTGLMLARRVGLKKIALELGGNDPFIVLKDADLPTAARIAAAGAMATAGQACRGIKRLLVETEVAERFAALLVEEVRGKVCGDPLDPETDIGSLVDEAAAIRAEGRCRAAVAEGAVLLCGGERRGALMSPTVLDRVAPRSELVTQETFAPVAPIIRIRDLDEAIEIANGTIYGLQAGVATRDFAAFETLATGLRVGAVNLMEGPQFDSPHIPFGGVKQSGLGREGVRYAMREMCTVKTVVLPWSHAAPAHRLQMP